MQSALIVVVNVKSHSNLTRTDQSIVEIVFQKEDEQEDTITRRLRERIVYPTIFQASTYSNYQRFPV